VGFGLYYWFKITGDPPRNSLQVEVTGRQFAWIARYPGRDQVFGKKYYKNISDPNNNQLGLIWEDKAAQDDIVVSGSDIYLIKDKPVHIIINSRDVVHDLGLSHFRMKMDAVPGTPTTMWFTPKYTTQEMKVKTNNPDFEYEISCDQMCGSGHYSMKGLIHVVTQVEFDLWMAKQKPNYVLVNQEQPQPAPAKDSAAKATAVNTTTKGTNN
jgi:cytochrome c oxidase subunit 2